MSWEDKLRSVLKKYLEHQATQDAVVTYYRSARSMRRALAGRDLETGERDDMGRTLLEFTYSMPSNPFLSIYGPQMQGVYQTAANSLMDSFEYIMAASEAKTPESKAELSARALGCQMQIHEIALMAHLCEKGYTNHRMQSRTFRDELMALEEIL